MSTVFAGEAIGLENEPLLDKVVDSLIKGLGDQLKSIVLFGSRARGDARPGSDWDLLVIAEGLPERPFRRLRYLKGLLPILSRSNISILAKTPDEFESSLQALYLDIALDGIILYDTQNYGREKLASVKGLISRNKLRRRKIGKDLVWQWEEFPGFNWSVEWEIK